MAIDPLPQRTLCTLLKMMKILDDPLWDALYVIDFLFDNTSIESLADETNDIF